MCMCVSKAEIETCPHKLDEGFKEKILQDDGEFCELMIYFLKNRYI